jgi:hypothetical protein
MLFHKYTPTRWGCFSQRYIVHYTSPVVEHTRSSPPVSTRHTHTRQLRPPLATTVAFTGTQWTPSLCWLDILQRLNVWERARFKEECLSNVVCDGYFWTVGVHRRPVSTCTHLPVCTFHTRTSPSSLPVANLTHIRYYEQYMRAYMCQCSLAHRIVAVWPSIVHTRSVLS